MKVEATEPVSVLIVERRPRLAISLARVLGSSGMVRVVGRVDDPTRLREMVESLTPEVVLMNADRPGCPLVDVCMELTQKYKVGVVLHTAEAESQSMHEALAAGARCIVARPFRPRHLILGVIHAGLHSRSDNGLSTLPDVENRLREDSNLITSQLAPLMEWGSTPAVGEISPRLLTHVS